MADKIEEDPNNIGDIWAPQAWAHLKSVSESSPLIQRITNFVSVDFVANVLIYAGVSPAMIHSIEEIPDFAPKTHALYINLVTLTRDWLLAMKPAAKVANESGKPWVLDQVAAGASGRRLSSCSELLKMRPTVIRGMGTGRSIAALIAAFVAIDPFRPLEATASALSVFGVANEIGMDLAKGPASLRMHLIDSLHGIDQAILLQRVNIESM